MIGQQLQGNGGQHRGQQAVRAGNAQHPVGATVRLPVIVKSHRHHPRPPGFGFPQTGHGLVVDVVLGEGRHHRRAFFYQGQGAVFQLPGGHGFGVQVGNLFEFQSPFHGGGVVRPPADEIQVGGAGQIGRQPADPLPPVAVQNLGDLAGQGLQSGQQGRFPRRFHRSPAAGQPQGQQAFADQHGQIGFGGGHRHLRTAPGVNDVVGGAGESGAHHVGQSQQTGVPLGCHPGRGQRVGRFPGLADGQSEVRAPRRREPVAQFVGVNRFGGKARQTFHQGHPHQPGVVGGAATGDPDFLQGVQIYRGGGGTVPPAGELLQVIQHRPAAVVRDAPRQGLGDHLRLLMYFFEHEMVVSSPFRLPRLPVGDERLPVDLRPVDGLYHRPVGGHIGDFPIFHHQKPAGAVEQGGDIGGQEHFPFAQAHHQRAG